MNTASRSAILQRLRAAPADPAAPASLPAVTDWYAQHRRSEDHAQRLQRLRAQLQAARAEMHDTTAQTWPQTLAGIAQTKQIRTLAVGQQPTVQPRIPELQAAGLQLLPYDRAIESWKTTLFDQVDAGLSVARSAIAETGSIVLWTGPTEPRLLSLVPHVHFVLLDVCRLHANLHAAMADEAWAEAMPTNVLLVSGPSKTADIQQTLAYGAHGPRELVVLLLHPEEISA